MENDEIKKLEEKQEATLALVQKLWRAEKWRRFWAVLKYVVFIGIVFGAFFFLTPYIKKAADVFQQIQNVQNISNRQDLQKILQQLKK